MFKLYTNSIKIHIVFHSCLLDLIIFLFYQKTQHPLVSSIWRTATFKTYSHKSSLFPNWILLQECSFWSEESINEPSRPTGVIEDVCKLCLFLLLLHHSSKMFLKLIFFIRSQSRWLWWDSWFLISLTIWYPMLVSMHPLHSCVTKEHVPVRSIQYILTGIFQRRFTPIIDFYETPILNPYK